MRGVVGRAIVAAAVLCLAPARPPLSGPDLAAQPFTGIEIRSYAFMTGRRFYAPSQQPPVPGARVTITPAQGEALSVVTGPDGLARVPVAPGDYRIRWAGTERFITGTNCEEVSAYVEDGNRTVVHLRAYDLVDGRPGENGAYSLFCPTTIRLFTPD